MKKLIHFCVNLLVPSLIVVYYANLAHARNYDKVLKSLKYPKKLVFDITKHLQSDNIVKHADFMNLDTLRKSEVRLSPLIYFGQRKHMLYSDSGLVDGNIFVNLANHTVGYDRIPVYFLAPLQDKNGLEKDETIRHGITITPHAMESFLRNLNSNEKTSNKFTVVFSLNEWLNNDIKENDDDGNRLFKLISDFKSRWPNVTVGLEFDNYDGGDVYGLLSSISKQVNVFILKIDICLADFVPSYSYFKAQLQDTFKKFLNLQTEMDYVKINLLSFEEHKCQILKDELYQRYFYYLLQYSVYWINQGEIEGIILPSFNKSVAKTKNLGGRPLKELITIPIEINRNTYKETCELMAWINHVSSEFKTISIDLSTLNAVHFGYNQCQPVYTNFATCASNSQTTGKLCVRQNESFSFSDKDVFYNLRIRKTDFELDHINFTVNFVKRHIKTDKLAVVSLVSWVSMSLFYIEKDLKYLFDEINQVVNITCDSDDYRNYNTYGDYQSCFRIWHQSATIMWHFRPGVKDAFILTKVLAELERSRQMFLAKFNDKSTSVRFQLDFRTEVIQVENIGSIYCQPEMLRYNEYLEVVMNFARIHNIPFEIVTTDEIMINEYAWWTSVKILDEVDPKSKRFFVFVARNYPKQFLLGDFRTDPCISWTSEVPQNGIEINSNYTGTIIFINEIRNKTLTPNELQTMLLFALHKFSLVEIILGSYSDFDIILSVLSEKKFADKFKIESNITAKIYIRIYIDLTTKKEIEDKMETMKNLILKPAGVHFVVDSNNLDLVNRISNKLDSTGIMLGLSLERCVREVSNNFANVKFVDKLDYIICNIEKLLEASNSNKPEMSKYLDTTLYIKKYFQHLYPNSSVELLFRLNVVPNLQSYEDMKTNEHYQNKGIIHNKVPSFLKFIADVNQYATAYRLKMFTVPAFDSMFGGHIGWWRISNNTDLTNVSIYFEKESELLARDSWRPEEGEEILTKEDTELVLILSASAVVIIIVIIIAAIFMRVWYLRNYSVLTKKEASQFQSGNAEYIKLNTLDEMEIFEHLKFPLEFDIPKNKIDLLNVIGKGNFGLVYNAKMFYGAGDNDKDGIFVAVKVPHPNCSKNDFKGALSELKVLCYIGKHPHVLSFLGAYIKEIGNGIIYIVTELCDNGSLIEYLQKQFTRLRERNKRSLLSPNLQELYQFSHEIALGMDYIASKKVIHGDLSARNILLDSNFTCKIADFGLSGKLYTYQEYIKKKDSEPLPWRWLAIESITRLEFTTKSDVWSYGITLWEIFSLGRLPYPGLNFTEQFLNDLESGYRLSAPTYATRTIHQEMIKCWEINPSIRPDFDQLAKFFGTLMSAEHVQYTNI